MLPGPDLHVAANGTGLAPLPDGEADAVLRDDLRHGCGGRVVPVTPMEPEWQGAMRHRFERRPRARATPSGRTAPASGEGSQSNRTAIHPVSAFGRHDARSSG